MCLQCAHEVTDRNGVLLQVRVPPHDVGHFWQHVRGAQYAIAVVAITAAVGETNEAVDYGREGVV
jgi:hypothetical protein